MQCVATSSWPQSNRTISNLISTSFTHVLDVRLLSLLVSLFLLVACIQCAFVFTFLLCGRQIVKCAENWISGWSWLQSKVFHVVTSFKSMDRWRAYRLRGVMCESTSDSSQSVSTADPVLQNAEGDEAEVFKPATPSGNAYALAIRPV